MADELNIPTHRWYQKRNHIALAKQDVSRQYIYDSGIQKIDAWINSQPWGSFSPSSLFANDEPGVWYDPSDLSTLFQDDAGTTPVTAAGQTVALMLDKSQGLILGPELVPVIDFTDGWVTAGDGVIDSANEFTTSSGGGVYKSGVFEVGRFHQVSFNVSLSTSSLLRVYEGLGGVPFFSGTDTSFDVTSIVFAKTSEIYFRTSGAVTLTLNSVSVKELPGYHATQPTAAARPTYQTDGTYHWLSFDGVDDFMVTPTITPGIDKAQVFAGVRKLSDASAAILIEFSPSVANNGSLHITAPQSASSGNYGSISRGTIFVAANTAAFPAPRTDTLSLLADISGDSSVLRVGGVVEATSAGDQGTGNFLAYPLYIGARSGTSLPFNGNIYSLVTRFGANLETATIETTETYVAEKIGVTL